jgi:hypothetical protein
MDGVESKTPKGIEPVSCLVNFFQVQFSLLENTPQNLAHRSGVVDDKNVHAESGLPYRTPAEFLPRLFSLQ